MDDEQKKAALQTADQKIADANKAVTDAKAALETAKGTKDDAQIKAAESKVSTAETALEAARQEKADLEASDVDDIVADATKPPNLKDGTPGDKKISVNKDKFDDLNEKAKLFEQFAPLLAKVKNDPAALERLMAGDDPSQDIQTRLKRLEDKENLERQQVITKAIKDAQATWPRFKSKWEEVKPLLNGLVAQGVPYAEATQRAYFAVDPDAMKEGKRLVELQQAHTRQNERGKQSPGGGGGAPNVGAEPETEYQLSDADREFAQKTGVDPKLYSKHAKWISRFDDLE